MNTTQSRSVLIPDVQQERAAQAMASLLDHLFQTHRRPDGKEYTYQEVETATEQRLSGSYVRKVRAGIITNPGRDALLDLAQFFNVPVSYFFPGLADEDWPHYPREEYVVSVARVAVLLAEQATALRFLERAVQLAQSEDRGEFLAALVAVGKHNQERLEALVDVRQSGNQASEQHERR